MAIGTVSRWFEKAFSAKSAEQESVATESIMDFSDKNGLCSDIWDRDGGEYKLKEDVLKKLKDAADWAVEKYGLKEPIVRLIGSICSNAFDEKTDLDVHITDVTLDKSKREEINAKMRKEFAKRGDEENSCGTHPIELYIQENKYRDLLSVGCYNLNEEKWECGPMLYPDGYDPYATYFGRIYTNHRGLIESVRNSVMEAIEIGYAIILADGKSEEDFSDKIAEVVSRNRKYLEECRNMRGALSEPKSEDEAAEVRESEEWKLSDATFKLLGKYGYISFMKRVADMDDGIGSDEFSKKIVEITGKTLFGIGK